MNSKFHALAIEENGGFRTANEETYLTLKEAKKALGEADCPEGLFILHCEVISARSYP